ncbi:two-component system sensor histidine kinase NtrB [Spiribacter halobius]|uniref:histidine kinase n=1 Tax=Sediminicurvatus halobius TaxID=2182432 RepID=A0A2U2N393_9GAMM|nr:ATP-binding protein [Spiribacter halobius]PWG63691.1 hypothetical protein DEM34_07380 [Spiribacter halobius]UEX79830.1 hypothetical protein LMH63_09340 [Spiribacter halobius]
MIDAGAVPGRLDDALAIAAQAAGAGTALLLDATGSERAMVVAQWPTARLATGVTVPTAPLAPFAAPVPQTTREAQLPAVLLSACGGRPQALWFGPPVGAVESRCRLLFAWADAVPDAPPLEPACRTLDMLLSQAARPPGALSPAALLLGVLEALPHGVAFVEDGARWVVMSPAAALLLGAPTHSVTPAEFSRLMRGFIGSADNAAEAGERLALDGSPDDPRSADLRRGERVLFVQHRPLELAQASGRVWILADVTHERRRERQLLEASRMELVTRITGGVAHEFNNLLMRITASADLLLDDALLDERSRGYLESILRASEHGADLVRRLLTYSRRRVMVAQQIDPLATVQDTAALIRSNLPRHVVLEADLPASVPKVIADPALLETSLLALALNAIEAMEESGTITLTVGTTADGEVVITLRDTGVGMSPEVLARAREPFFSHRRHGFGTGLGLSMADGFARESGGRLTLDSTPGEGTTATLILPPA